MKNSFLFSLLVTLVFTGCVKKNEPDAYNSNTSPQYNNLSKVKEVLMQKIIVIAKSNPEFKKSVEAECLKQARGDYNVTLDKLVEEHRQTPIIPSKERNAFISLIKQMKDFKPGAMPILYVPIMETRDPKLAREYANKRKAETQLQTNPNSYIIMVDRDNEIKKEKKSDNLKGSRTNDDPDDEDHDPLNCQAPLCYPGYIIDDSYNLTYYACISEDMANEYDVWILGYDEEVCSENQVMSPFDSQGGGSRVASKGSTSQARVDGTAEYTGFIQVTNLGYIEPWIYGKVEFRVYVYDYKGTLLMDHPFGKLRRAHFNSNQWSDLHQQIGYWNTSNWGNVTYERWIEEDGGVSSGLSFGISYTSNGVTQNVMVNTPAKDQDDNLGTFNAQFNDPTWVSPVTNPASWPHYSLLNLNVQRHDF